MNTVRFLLVVTVIASGALLTLSVTSHSVAHEQPSLVMGEAARNFLAALTPDQRAKALLPFEGDQRKDWHFIPKERKGVPLKDLEPWQQHLAHAFISAGLSQRGYIKTTTIMSLEEILRAAQGSRGPARDPDLYYISIFGDPGADGPWGWSLEGHHVSLNFTVVGDSMIATTPAFFGSNPAEVMDGPRKGLRVLGREEDLARSLLLSLNPEQRAMAVIAAEAPRDIATANQIRVQPLEPKGLPASRMGSEQVQVLITLLEEYANSMPAALTEERMAKMRSADLETVMFAWAGSAERGKPHYYRVQGPEFLVEYDNTQGNANHVHSVWRDFDGDFGEDILTHHYRTAPHHQRN